MVTIVKKDKVGAAFPDWKWGDIHLEVSDTLLTYYDNRVLLSDAKKLAQQLSDAGYRVAIIEGSSPLGWAIYYSGVRIKPPPY